MKIKQQNTKMTKKLKKKNVNLNIDKKNKLLVIKKKKRRFYSNSPFQLRLCD